MARYCSFKECKSKSSDGILIFKIPNDPKSAQEWKKFVKKSGNKNAEETKVLNLCQFHFSSDDINHQWRPPRLRPNSVPIFTGKRVNI
jgi:hypothetical protein